MKKIKLKRNNKKNNHLLNITIIFIIILIVIYFILFNTRGIPVLIKYSELEITRITNDIVNNAVKKQVKDRNSFNNIIITKENNKKEIVSVDFDTIKVNKNLNIIAGYISNNLMKYTNNEKNKMNIASGIIFTSPLLSTIGPKFPIQIKSIGSIITKLETEVKEYGINSMLLKVYVNVEVIIQLLIPYETRQVKIENKIPVIMKIINGRIPSYYGTNESNMSIPIEK